MTWRNKMNRPPPRSRSCWAPMTAPMPAVASPRKWQAASQPCGAMFAGIFDERVAKVADLQGAIDTVRLDRLREAHPPIVTVDRDWSGQAVDARHEVWRGKAPLFVDSKAEAAQ